MKKIVAFDSWTEGSYNLTPLVEPLKAQGYHLLLIHVGSWGHDLNRPLEEKINELLVRDIQYYGSSSFKEILLKEKPSLVIFLSMTSFVHRAFNRYCRLLKIPTLNLYHGLVTVQDIDASNPYQINASSQVRKIIRTFPKQLFRIWPNYMRALLYTTRKSLLKDFFRFGLDVYLQLLGKQYHWGKAAEDSMTTAICVYVKADVEHAIARYGVDKKRVFVVGNPDLNRFKLDEADLGILCNHDLTEDFMTSNTVVYVENALLEFQSIFEDVYDYVQYLRKIADELVDINLRMLFKPHPSSYQSGLVDKIIESGIEISSNKDFLENLKSSCCAIVEPSSASVIPALIGLPLFLNNFDRLSNQKYGKALTSYPRASYLRNFHSFQSDIKFLRSETTLTATRQWVEDMSGPLPSEEMPTRVVDVVAKLVESE